ncbi:peptidylprolyl isomerase [Calothrix sp. FACHB-1219]|uniref:peptidylprolyl isomerase n=1 Tax=unclassified Calothrix TaxID=2619626 RepID=UPI001682AAA7|nr:MULTISPECIES: peptidylprolyl isomerase [unclassified Calothrix]MBD2204863.1 peptidylprolyl isomerase [Calothrix sp. FACHB-168]MBD2216311.1 peptidylprolyl isomerase [Calothrix sp. FACHB-1219]
MINLSKSIVEPEEIVNLLKSEMNFKDVCQKVWFQRLINDIAQERGINVTPAEIEAEANRQRREKHLEKASDTLTWLADQLVSAEDWEIGIRDRLLSKKLAEALFAQDVELFFIENQLEFEQVSLYQIIVESEKLAQEIYYQIAEAEITFYDAAHIYDIDIQRRKHCGYEGNIYRFALEPDIAAALFSASTEELIGPLKSEQGYHLFWVDEFIPATLTPERYQEILNDMFNNWLNQEMEYMFNS